MAFPARTIISRRALARGFFMGVAFALSVNAHAVTAPVGSTPGSFAVNAHGGATYTIPIVAPPGTAGITPPDFAALRQASEKRFARRRLVHRGAFYYYPLRDDYCH